MLRSFMTVSVERSARRRVARSPVREHRGLQRVLGEMVASLVSAREKDTGSKVRLQRVREYIRTFFGHGVRHRQEDDEADTLGPRSASHAEVAVIVDGTGSVVVDHSTATEPVRGATGGVLRDANLRREANELLLAQQGAAAMLVDRARAKEPPLVLVDSFRATAFASVAEHERTIKLQREADSRLLAHHDDTVRLGDGKLSISSPDEWTTLVRVEVSDLEPFLDKASLSARTLPKLLRRKLNTQLSAEQRSFGRTVVISEARSNAVIAVWMPGALGGPSSWLRSTAC